MTSRKRSRLARRRLKMHTLDVSHRHNKTMAWLRKRERKQVSSGRQYRPPPRADQAPVIAGNQAAAELERPSLREQLEAAIENGRLPDPRGDASQ